MLSSAFPPSSVPDYNQHSAYHEHQHIMDPEYQNSQQMYLPSQPSQLHYPSQISTTPNTTPIRDYSDLPFHPHNDTPSPVAFRPLLPEELLYLNEPLFHDEAEIPERSTIKQTPQQTLRQRPSLEEVLSRVGPSSTSFGEQSEPNALLGPAFGDDSFPSRSGTGSWESDDLSFELRHREEDDLELTPPPVRNFAFSDDGMDAAFARLTSQGPEAMSMDMGKAGGLLDNILGDDSQVREEEQRKWKEKMSSPLIGHADPDDPFVAPQSHPVPPSSSRQQPFVFTHAHAQAFNSRAHLHLPVRPSSAAGRVISDPSHPHSTGFDASNLNHFPLKRQHPHLAPRPGLPRSASYSHTPVQYESPNGQEHPHPLRLHPYQPIASGFPLPDRTLSDPFVSVPLLHPTPRASNPNDPIITPFRPRHRYTGLATPSLTGLGPNASQFHTARHPYAHQSSPRAEPECYWSSSPSESPQAFSPSSATSASQLCDPTPARSSSALGGSIHDNEFYFATPGGYSRGDYDASYVVPGSATSSTYASIPFALPVRMDSMSRVEQDVVMSLSSHGELTRRSPSGSDKENSHPIEEQQPMASQQEAGSQELASGKKTGSKKKKAATTAPATIVTDADPQGLPDGPRMNTKPEYSYAAMIGQAIYGSAKERLSLADIYTWVSTAYPYYKKGDAGWMNSIRHNLSLNKSFVKVPREAGDPPGKGMLWTIVPNGDKQLENRGYWKKTGTSSTPRSRAGSTKPADQKPESAKSAPKIDKKKPLALVDASTPLPSNTKRKRTPVPAVQPSSPSIPHTIEGPPPTPASVTDMDQGVFATVTLAQGGSSVTKKIRLVDSRPRPGNTTRKSPNPSASKSLFSQPYSTFSMPPPNLIPSHSAAASASTTGSAELAPQDALDDFATPRRAHSRGPPVSSSTSAEQHASSSSGTSGGNNSSYPPVPAFLSSLPHLTPSVSSPASSSPAPPATLPRPIGQLSSWAGAHQALVQSALRSSEVRVEKQQQALGGSRLDSEGEHLEMGIAINDKGAKEDAIFVAGGLQPGFQFQSSIARLTSTSAPASAIATSSRPDDTASPSSHLLNAYALSPMSSLRATANDDDRPETSSSTSSSRPPTHSTDALSRAFQPFPHFGSPARRPGAHHRNISGGIFSGTGNGHRRGLSATNELINHALNPNSSAHKTPTMPSSVGSPIGSSSLHPFAHYHASSSAQQHSPWSTGSNSRYLGVGLSYGDEDPYDSGRAIEDELRFASSAHERGKAGESPGWGRTLAGADAWGLSGLGFSPIFSPDKH